MTRWILVVPFLCGCQSMVDGAKEIFSQSKTCPIERVEARERPELKSSQFYQRPAPPPDVAADPGRLAMWQTQQDQNATVFDDHDQIVEARGCGKHVFLACGRPTSTTGNQRWACTEETYVPSTISQW